MPAKLDRCVADVKKDSDVDNPFAVCNASIGESFIANGNYRNMPQEGGPGSGRKGHTTSKPLEPTSKGGPVGRPDPEPEQSDRPSDYPDPDIEPQTFDPLNDPVPTNKAGEENPFLADVKRKAKGQLHGFSPKGPGAKSGTSKEGKPLTMTEADRLIQEMQAKPMTGSTKKMSGGSKGKAPKHWTPVDFNVLDKAQGQKPVPPPVGRAVKEANICEVCGVPGENHQEQDHPMIPPMPIENNMPPMPNGMANDFPPTEPSPQMLPPQPQEQQPFPQPNGMPPNTPIPPMPQEQDDFPPDSQPPIYPPEPQEQMPLPSPMPTAPQPQRPEQQMQYTVSIPNSLSAQSIGGKKINEMIREIEFYIKQK